MSSYACGTSSSVPCENKSHEIERASVTVVSERASRCTCARWLNEFANRLWHGRGCGCMNSAMCAQSCGLDRFVQSIDAYAPVPQRIEKQVGSRE